MIPPRIFFIFGLRERIPGGGRECASSCAKEMSKTPNIAIDKGGSFLYNYSTVTIVVPFKGGNQLPRGAREGLGGGGGECQIP